MTIEERIELALLKSRFSEDIDLDDPPASWEVYEEFVKAFIIETCGWVPGWSSQSEYYRLKDRLWIVPEIVIIRMRIEEWVGAAWDRKRAQPGYVDWPPF